jgi:hypothetical protein
MFHLHGWAEDVDPAGAFNALTALTDSLGLADGDELIVPSFNKVFAISAGIPSGGNQRVRLTAPSFSALTRLDVSQINGNADADAEPDSPQGIMDLRGTMLTLVEDERVTCDADSNPTAAQLHWCLLWFSDGQFEPVPAGPRFVARATGTTTLVVNVWTNGTLTFTDALPVGRYAVVGMRAQSTNLAAARLVFRDRWNRPGVLGTDAIGDKEWPAFRHGGLGSWGEFESVAPPTVDYLAGVADTAETVLLDLVQVRAGRG